MKKTKEGAISAPGGPRIAAFVPRTAALFILLYQIRLFAADMADTPFFAAALAGALASAVFLNRKKFNGRAIRPFQALIVLALIPWAIRLFVAMPRWLIPGAADRNAALLDSLLLNLDRNNFSALLPFYWAAVSSYFSQRSRVFLRADIIAGDVLFLAIFSVAPTASLNAYRWPILMIGLFALVLFLQFLSLILSAPPELKLRRKEEILAGGFLFLLIFLGGAFFVRPFQEKAVERGGGLLEPKLFRFDFSQVLRLESEISVSDDLVFIVKKDPGDNHTLLRRYTLSGYGQKRGFFRLDDVDEAAHPQSLPGGPSKLPVREIEKFRAVNQEYYLVNFDSSAFIGMNMPVEITPFETWDASSFNSAYAVTSHASEALSFELAEAGRGAPDPETLRLSAEEYALYTDYGGDEAIAAFARETVGGGGGSEGSLPYWEQIQMVYDRLKFGEYRYSLKPGIAPDGDQLKHFLFSSKKGYCSYYAFAFALTLRSLGIPSRVAAGFFIDPLTEAFDYYPVRADMAHAWVEVWFPGYGWIEYDPTSEEIAEGEELRFSQGTPPELFERLMKEILENRSRLRAKTGEEEGPQGGFAGLGGKTLRFLSRRGPFVAAAALALLFLAMRSGFLWLSIIRKNPRKKAVCLWAHAKRRLALAGIRKSPALGDAEWAKALDGRFGGLYALYQSAAAARFAPDFASGQGREAAARYRLWSGGYGKTLSPGRRLLAWILPPLALVLPPSKSAGGPGSRNAGLLLLAAMLISLQGETGRAQEEPAPSTRLYEDVLMAMGAENWERAVELLGAGAKAYPWDARFPETSGDLYYQRGLYRLAWDEYRRAEAIFYGESRGTVEDGADPAADAFVYFPELCYKLASTAGFLNMNAASADYLEKVLLVETDNREAIGSLAWMRFKLHRLKDGEELLLRAIEDLGEDSDFCMTLGTIYSGMFQYQKAKEAYLKSIAGAEKNGNWLSAALAHYNLSILENRFYQYRLAYERANSSLAIMDRASGRLARGEMHLRRMELARALAEYGEGYEADSSPLSKMSLADAFRIGGRLAEAARYAEDCLSSSDQSWMLNYGTDPVRYKRDIHEILKDTYDGLFEAEKYAATAGLKEKAQSLFRAASYRFRGAAHRHLFRKYSLLAADAYGPGGDLGMGEIHVEALLQYFDALEGYPRRALAYLRKARSFEEPIIPGSAPSYKYEEGRLLNNREMLAESLSEFDPLWERDMIADVYAELASRGGNRAEREDAAERLFALNRGALLRNGVALPVELKIEANAGHIAGVLKKAAKKAGLEPGNAAGPGSRRYTLAFGSGGEGIVACELYDNGRGIALFRQNLPLPSNSAPHRAAFSRALRDGAFNAF